MNRFFILMMVWLLCGSQALQAQTNEDWQQLYEQLTDLEEMETAEWEDVHEVLSELSEHPIDLNRATFDDLLQLPFLTEQETEAVFEYIDRYRPLRSLGELSMIEQLSYAKRQLLTCFVCVEQPTDEKPFPRWQNIIKHGQRDLLLTANVPFFERRGDHDGYLGYPYRHHFRFNQTYGQYFRAGLVGAQDAGEPFLSKHNRAGYDFYSYYVQLKNLGVVKNLVAGRYRAGFGLGLVMNTNYTLGKQGALSSLGLNRQTLRPHSSTSSSNYLQGAAVTMKAGRHGELTAFLSSRKIDATLTPDSTGIRTIVQTGYHRTLNEIQKKGNATQSVAGGHYSYRASHWHAGATAFYAHTSRPLRPDTSVVFRRFQAFGQHFWNASIDYGYRSGRLALSGETATGDGHGWAALHTLSWRIAPELDLLALHRFYGKRYYSLFSRSFSDGGDVQNESGVYMGASWRPNGRFTLTSYADFAYSPWPRYQVSHASHSADFLVSALWTDDSWTLSGRYRLRRRERNDSTSAALSWRTEQRTRLALTWKSQAWSLKTQLDGALTSQDGKRSVGWMVSEQAEVQIGKQWRLNATAGYFHTDDYQSRVYLYERSMQYQFSFPAFYGEGLRYTLFAHWNISKRLSLRARVATTNYFDRKTIGTGLQTIDHSSMTAADVQLHWKF